MAAVNRANRYQVLCYEQIERLHEVMQDAIPVHGRGNFPTLSVKLTDLVNLVKQKLKDVGVNARDIRINGGAASYIIGMEQDIQSFNDLDLIFGVDLSSQSDLQKIKNAVLDSLLDFLPYGVNKEKMGSCSLKEAYVQKLVRVCSDTDRWSLISLSHNKRRNVELKFVDRMKRQFEFSVDSFQIVLDSLLTFYEISQTSMTEHFYPTVVAESMYGNFGEALYHLNHKLIATRHPEEIRGGGLFKYCHLLVRGYSPAAEVDIKAMERYMCSRFFIDFSDIGQQRVKLEKYLTNHFKDEDHIKYDYLMTLSSVIDESTICLMGHERRQTLTLIEHLACRILAEQETKAHRKQLKMQLFDQHNIFDECNNLIIDQVFYGPFTVDDKNQIYGYTYSPATSYSMLTTCPLCPCCPSARTTTYLQCS